MILKGTPATISVQFYDADVAADPGVTTIKVDRADGTNLVAAGTSTSGVGTVPRTFALTTTHTAAVDVLEATWTSPSHGTVRTYHPVVGGFYVDLKTLRDSDLSFSEESKFPDQALADARWWWHTLVDDYCSQSFVPAYRLEESWWTGVDLLALDRPHVRAVLSATVNGVAVDTTSWVPTRSGWVRTLDGDPTIDTGLLRISYEHGHDYPDGELYEAGIVAMRSKLLSDRSGRPSRMTLITNELGTVRLAQPGDKRATGIPEVDAVLERRKSAAGFVVA